MNPRSISFGQPSYLNSTILRMIYPYCRPLLRMYWRSKLSLPRRSSNQKLRTGITPIVIVKNEDIWIETILLTLCKIFPKVIVIDNGSGDLTIPILQKLKSNGLKIILILYYDRFKNDGLIKNLVIDRLIDTKWWYLVDGDELQFEESCKKLFDNFSQDKNANIFRYAIHAQHCHPNSIFKITAPFCEDVRYQHGRIFSTDEVRFNEPGRRNVPLLKANTVGSIKPEVFDTESDTHSLFLTEIKVLHLVFSKRSSIVTEWKGVQSIHEKSYLRRNEDYVSKSGNYISLDIFPKELIECQYSGHNPYRAKIISSTSINLV